MEPERLSPDGEVHVEDEPIPVQIVLRLRRPPLEYQVQGWVVAWTQNAVLVLWIQRPGEAGGKRARTRWIPPADVKRLPKGSYPGD